MFGFRPAFFFFFVVTVTISNFSFHLFLSYYTNAPCPGGVIVTNR